MYNVMYWYVRTRAVDRGLGAGRGRLVCGQRLEASSSPAGTGKEEEVKKEEMTMVIMGYCLSTKIVLPGTYR